MNTFWCTSAYVVWWIVWVLSGTFCCTSAYVVWWIVKVLSGTFWCTHAYVVWWIVLSGTFWCTRAYVVWRMQGVAGAELWCLKVKRLLGELPVWLAIHLASWKNWRRNTYSRYIIHIYLAILSQGQTASRGVACVACYLYDEKEKLKKDIFLIYHPA